VVSDSNGTTLFLTLVFGSLCFVSTQLQKVISRDCFHDDWSKEAVIAAYNKHNAEVQKHVPQSKLLVINLTSNAGWAPLCKHLGKTIPQNVPFPYEKESNWWLNVDTSTVSGVLYILFVCLFAIPIISLLGSSGGILLLVSMPIAGKFLHDRRKSGGKLKGHNDKEKIT
jgi:hypothetical protein